MTGTFVDIGEDRKNNDCRHHHGDRNNSGNQDTEIALYAAVDGTEPLPAVITMLLSPIPIVTLDADDFSSDLLALLNLISITGLSFGAVVS